MNHDRLDWWHIGLKSVCVCESTETHVEEEYDVSK